MHTTKIRAPIRIRPGPRLTGVQAALKDKTKNKEEKEEEQFLLLLLCRFTFISFTFSSFFFPLSLSLKSKRNTLYQVGILAYNFLLTFFLILSLFSSSSLFHG